MRFVRCAIAVVLSLLMTPLVISHGCGLKSSLFEIPIIILAGTVFPLLVLRQKVGWKSWLLVVVSPIVALGITVGYDTCLHSPSFPDVLLDQSAREWKTIGSRLK